MNAAQGLLDQLCRIGASITRDGERLVVRAGQAPIPTDMMSAIRERKAELLGLLCGDAAVQFEERAAIIEEGSGARREWAEAFAQLDCARPPADVPSRRWRQFIDDCGRFLDDGWPARAIALGWKPLDLFGADRVKPFARVDQAGLLWLIAGGTLVALTATTATIETQTGARQTYRRCAGPADRALPRQLAQDILGSHGLARVHARSPLPPR